MDLKGAIGDQDINNKLDEVYNELYLFAETEDCNKTKIFSILREVWENMEELSLSGQDGGDGKYK
ncbi:hypothetical protein HYT51_03210 [Candidatus Woesearchaeota archaeon]|nr:hypothetical protein [Candidatus Woesearchaeota archaeon]